MAEKTSQWSTWTTNFCFLLNLYALESHYRNTSGFPEVICSVASFHSNIFRIRKAYQMMTCSSSFIEYFSSHFPEHNWDMSNNLTWSNFKYFCYSSNMSSFKRRQAHLKNFMPHFLTFLVNFATLSKPSIFEKFRLKSLPKSKNVFHSTFPIQNKNNPSAGNHIVTFQLKLNCY